jgi:outer membrane receptor protein involved in Fe transport
MTFHLSAMPLDEELRAYAATTGRQLLYASELVAGVRGQAVEGRFDANQALERVLANTGVRVVRAEKKVVILGAVKRAPISVPAPPVRAPKPARPRIKDSATEAKPDDATIVVTGSNIRGGNGFSPVLSLDREAMDRAGYGSVAELVAALPQSFGGTANEDSSTIGTDRTAPNSGYGSSANLRGLGSDATLTLVNGRRLAGSGGKADFTDLSSIPAAAIDRIEILTDGASAIYGSDAVGGVVNLILRTDYRGAETRARLAAATGTSLRNVQISQLAGTGWTGGHILASYEYDRRGALHSADRRYTASSDLRAQGGQDFRTFYSAPTTVLRFDPVAGAYAPAYAVPDGQSGVGLTPAAFSTGANLSNQRLGTDVLPHQERHSGYVHLEQAVGTRVTAFLEGRYSHRRFDFASPASMTIAPVTRTNPYFVSPTGAALDVLGYDFIRDLGPIAASGIVQSWSATGGATWAVAGDWSVDAYASHAAEWTQSRFDNIINTTALFEALGTTPDDPETSFSTARDGFFNPYGSGSSNNPAILAFVGSGFSREYLNSRLDLANLKADGSLATLPGGALRLAVGGERRREHFTRNGASLYFGTAPTPLTATDAGRTVWAGYVEASIPLIGPGNARPGLQSLQISVAGRHERYSDFGSSTNPKLGLSWSPVADLVLRGTWGSSFRAPAVKERTDPLGVSATTLVNASGGRTTVLELSGGNPDLKAERARSASAGMIWQPHRMPGLRLELGWFRTAFRDRIGQPAYEDFALALRDVAYSPFVTFVDPVRNPQDLARLQALIGTPGAIVSSALPATAFQAIVDARYANTARLIVQGLDFALSDRVAVGSGSGSIRISGSWLADYKRQITPTAVTAERVATIGNPTDLRVRSSLGWDREDVGATLTLNYAHGYRDNLSLPERHIGAWATLDAQLRYSFLHAHWLRGMDVSLSVINLLNTAPPFANNSAGVGYDPANADPLGRVVALQLVRHW